MEKVALVEFGGSHDECLLSQLVALRRRGCHLTFVSTENLYKRNLFFQEYIDEVRFVETTGSAIGDFRKMLALNSYFKKERISKVILNTAQGGHVRNLCLTAPGRIEFIGIIHTLKKFQGSFTQKIINLKIKKYLVLNDFFLKKINPEKDQRVESFYPLRFPHFNNMIQKPEGEVWVTIIGGVENRRKDLMGSIELMKETAENIRFIFLGKSDPLNSDVLAFVNALKGSGLEKRIQMFHEFVDPKVFDSYLHQTDIIWPMVHPDTPSADEYFKNQISGAINIAFGYKIPLLVHQRYASQWEDLNSSISYEVSTFRNDLQTAIAKLNDFKSALVLNNKFNADFQEDKYLHFLFDKRV